MGVFLFCFLINQVENALILFVLIYIASELSPVRMKSFQNGVCWVFLFFFFFALCLFFFVCVC